MLVLRHGVVAEKSAEFVGPYRGPRSLQLAINIAAKGYADRHWSLRTTAGEKYSVSLILVPVYRA